jgi:Domain of unknown function (DUF4292)
VGARALRAGRGAAALGLALGLGAAGCHPRRPPPDLSLEPSALLGEVRAAQAKVHSVQGRARVSVESPRGGGATEQFLVAEKPARLRVEVYDFFGNLSAALTVDGDALSLYDGRERVFYRGPATPENVARLVPVAISPAELATLLCGSAPLIDGEATSAEPGDGTVWLTVRDGPLQQRLEIGPGATILSSRLSRLDGPSPRPTGLATTFSVHRSRAGARLPTDTTAREAGAGVSLSLTWRELTVNGAVDPALFRLAPPRGARVVDLDPLQP